MNWLSAEADSLSVLFTHGARAPVAFDKDLIRMHIEAARTEARISDATRQFVRQVEAVSRSSGTLTTARIGKDGTYGQRS